MTRISRFIVCSFAALAVVSASASPQSDRRGGPCDRLPDPPGKAKGIDKRCPDAGGGSSGIARGDFNGDGFADLAVGVPGEEVGPGQANSGAVNVIYGSAGGLTTAAGVPAAQLFTQDTAGVLDSSEQNDGFGSAVAAGDFNGDNFSDLAIGAPSDVQTRNGAASIGAVHIIFGSPAGLRASGAAMVRAPQVFAISDVNVGAQIEFFAATDEDFVPTTLRGSFGASLAWGDFNGDGIGDLAIGSPTEDIGPLPLPGIGGRVLRAGAVAILLGSSEGLTPTGSQLWTQNTGQIEGNAQPDDFFGHALAGGDFNGDGVTDLAIGAPDEDLTGTDTQGGRLIVNTGAVHIIFGLSGVGLTATNDRFFDQTTLFLSADATGVSHDGDLFGAALAAGDFDGNGFDDLAIGAHMRNARNRSNSGAVFVDYHGPGSPRTQFWDQSRIFGEGNTFEFDGSSSESDDRFGRALAAGDFNADRRDDLAIGVPFEDVVVDMGTSFSELSNAGAVDVIYGSTTGLSLTGRAPQHWTQNTINIEDQVEAEDFFGSSLTAWNFGNNQVRRTCGPFGFPCEDIVVGTADLAIGVPEEDLGSTQNAGAVNVIYGCARIGVNCPSNGLSAGVTTGEFPDRLWSQASPGVPGGSGPEREDQFGRAVY